MKESVDGWGAAICLRGCVQTPYRDPSLPLKESREQYCFRCGSPVRIACSACNLRIRALGSKPLHIGQMKGYERPSFCDGCGTAFPWTTDGERFDQLENLLAEAPTIDHADRVVKGSSSARCGPILVCDRRRVAETHPES